MRRRVPVDVQPDPGQKRGAAETVLLMQDRLDPENKLRAALGSRKHGGTDGER